MRLVRRNYFSNPRLQLRLLFVANVLAVMSAGLLVTLAYYTQSQLDSYWTVLALCSPGHPAIAQIAQRKTEITLICAGIAVLQLLLFNLMAVILSHRVSGPLGRLERHLEAVGNGGAAGDVRFRNGDLFEEIAVACNKVMARLRASGG